MKILLLSWNFPPTRGGIEYVAGHLFEGLRDRIERRVRELGLSGHVRLLGTVGDAELKALYRRAEIFLLPALELPGDVEGFGIVFSEAALARTPVVGTRTGGIPEAVADGKTGLVVPPGRPDELRAAVTRLLEDPAQREAMGRGGEERTRRCFAWDVILNRYEEALGRTLAPGRRASA